MKTSTPSTAIRTAELVGRVHLSPGERARVTAHVEQIESLIDFVAALASRFRTRGSRK